MYGLTLIIMCLTPGIKLIHLSIHAFAYVAYTSHCRLKFSTMSLGEEIQEQVATVILQQSATVIISVVKEALHVSMVAQELSQLCRIHVRISALKKTGRLVNVVTHMILQLLLVT